MLQKNAKKKRKAEAHEKEDIIRLLLREYADAPEDFWAYFPNIAEKLDKLVVPKKPVAGIERPFYFYLTEREKEFHLNSLEALIQKFKASGQLPKEEAIATLEHAAALQEQAATHKDSLLALAENVMETALDSQKGKVTYCQKGKNEHHAYTLARGITLSLTWDGKLIKITFDPKEFAIRQQALSFVGMGSDTATDVARRHDDYLEDAFGH